MNVDGFCDCISFEFYLRWCVKRLASEERIVEASVVMGESEKNKKGNSGVASGSKKES